MQTFPSGTRSAKRVKHLVRIPTLLVPHRLRASLGAKLDGEGGQRASSRGSNHYPTTLSEDVQALVIQRPIVSSPFQRQVQRQIKLGQCDRLTHLEKKIPTFDLSPQDKRIRKMTGSVIASSLENRPKRSMVTLRNTNIAE